MPRRRCPIRKVSYQPDDLVDDDWVDMEEEDFGAETATRPTPIAGMVATVPPVMDDDDDDDDGDGRDGEGGCHLNCGELNKHLGVAAWLAGGPGAGAEGAAPRTMSSVGSTWGARETHLFFRALRRCGRRPQKISDRIGTKSPSEVHKYMQELHAASDALGLVSAEQAAASGTSGTSSTEDDEEADESGCRQVSCCPHHPGCEGEQPLAHSTWFMRGWDKDTMNEEELEALRLFSLRNMSRYLHHKTNRHAYATFDSVVVLIMHRHLFALVRAVLRDAVLWATYRQRTIKKTVEVSFE